LLKRSITVISIMSLTGSRKEMSCYTLCIKRCHTFAFKNGYVMDNDYDDICTAKSVGKRIGQHLTFLALCLYALIHLVCTFQT